MKDFLVDAATNRLGMALLIASGVAVLVVDVARELTSDRERRPKWIAWVAFAVVPVLIVAAGVATVVRIFTLA